MMAFRGSTLVEERQGAIPGDEEEDKVMPDLGQEGRAKMLAGPRGRGKNSRRRSQCTQKHKHKCRDGEHDGV